MKIKNLQKLAASDPRKKALKIADKKIAEVKEENRPANLETIIIKNQNCKECYDISLFIESLKQGQVKIVSERTVDADSQEGKDLIKQFNISKIPTIIAKGEINKFEQLKALLGQLGDSFQGNTFVLRRTGAPYILLPSGDLRGKVKLTEITASNCSSCYDVKLHEQVLNQFGIYLEDKKIVDESSAEGQNLIYKYNIKLLPTIILAGDVSAYDGIVSIWSQVGTVENNAYIFREGVKQMGIYKDLPTGKIVTAKTNN